MRASNLKQGEYYMYTPASYGNGIKKKQIYKCERAYFDESENQWRANFVCQTDTYHCNSIGRIERFNEIEVDRYIEPIDNLLLFIGRYEEYELSEELLDKLYLIEKDGQ